MFPTEKGPRFLNLLRDYQHNPTSLSIRLAHQNHSDIVDIGQRRTGLQEIAGPAEECGGMQLAVDRGVNLQGIRGGCVHSAGPERGDLTLLITPGDPA